MVPTATITPQVDAYLSGHDHNLQHLAKDRDAQQVSYSYLTYPTLPTLTIFHVSLTGMSMLIGLQGVQYFVSGSGAKLGTFSPTQESLFGVVEPVRDTALL